MTVLFAACFAAVAELHSLVLAADLAVAPGGAAELWVIAPDGAWRRGMIRGARRGGMPLVLGFPAFACAEGALFRVVVLDGAGGLGAALRAEVGAPIAIGMPALEVALPARLAHGVFVVADGLVVDGNVAPNDFPVMADYGGYWRDAYGAYLSGWVHCGGLAVRGLFLRIGGQEVALALTPFPEVRNFYPEAVAPVRWGGYVAGPAGVKLQLRVVTDAGERLMEVALPARLTTLPPPLPTVSALFQRFIDEVNAAGLVVMEIGSRLASVDARSWRPEMARASGYIGVDIHPAANVDLLGDAHALSGLVAAGSVGAVWSAAVFEHLRMPWLVAAEINRVLCLGGLVYVTAPQTWPLHEMPADYWRFSDEALRVLFGPAFGFEVIGAALADEMRIMPPWRDFPYTEMPLHPGYATAIVLARKVAELPAASGLEAAQRAAIGETGLLYPAGDTERRAGDKRTPRNG